ncbi:MAG TPA: lmo0937 family membrane protein [Myxococcales bacterium]|nr:lmo0937 family membrane protein [Myxococcales bacterium]
MLWTISAILFVLWVLGLVSGGTAGLWIHLLLAFAVASLVLAVATSLPRPAVRG